MSKQFTTITDAGKPEISMDDFQSLVWQLSNQLFVRHYRWLNYPHKPQLFALQFADDIANTSLEAELKSLGFAWDLFNAFGRFSEKKVQIQIGQPNTVTSVAVSKLRDIFWLSGVSHCTVLVLPAVKARTPTPFSRPPSGGKCRPGLWGPRTVPPMPESSAMEADHRWRVSC